MRLRDLCPLMPGVVSQSRVCSKGVVSNVNEFAIILDTFYGNIYVDCIICSTTSNHPPLQSSKGRLLHPPPPSSPPLHILCTWSQPKNKNFSSHPPISPAPPITALTLHSMLRFLQGVGAQQAAPPLLHCWTHHHYYHYWGGAPLLFSPPSQRYLDAGWSVSSFSNGSDTLLGTLAASLVIRTGHGTINSLDLDDEGVNIMYSFSCLLTFVRSGCSTFPVSPLLLTFLYFDFGWQVTRSLFPNIGKCVGIVGGM
jgi:hypothetical protein